MAKFLQGKIDQTQKSNTTWLVTTIYKLIIEPVKELGLPVFSFKITQEAARQNSKIVSAVNGNLGAAMGAQNVISLEHGSEFRNITGIKNLLGHHEEKDRIVEIIQKYFGYHLSQIEKATRKSNLEDIILRGNHKSVNSALNSADL